MTVQSIAAARAPIRADADSPAVRREPALADLAARLRASRPVDAPDPLFRETLRARLVQRTPAFCYAPLDTPIGRLWIAYQGNLLRQISLDGEDDLLAAVRARVGEVPLPDPAPPRRIAAGIRAAIAGRRYTGPLDLSPLTAFQRQVLEAARRIPRGEVRSYAWIAREIGRPRAVRAVGTALARNPLPVVIPCHRVIHASGDLGAYSGGGPAAKARLLAHEGVDLAELRRLARQGIRFRGSRTTRIFCLPTCYSRRWARAEHTVYFHSAAEARAAGFRPCKLCRPAGEDDHDRQS
jgi:O-6-methylguanine DNA methyltransferase